ncbi:Isochorismatase-like protein, partial [Mycena galopus ATCC 62051]
LLLVDLQNEFLSPTGNFPIEATCQLALLENVAKAVRDFRASGDAVVWVRSEYAPGKILPPDLEYLQRTHTGKTPCCEPNSVGAEFPEAVAVLQAATDLVLTKTWYSAFTDTALRDELTARGITDMYVGGLLTNVCVRATAERAHVLGFAVTVLEDCLGWRKYGTHRQAIRLIQQSGIRVAMRHEV